MIEDQVIVIGHKNPDADAICSAIAYAAFKQQTDCPNAIPARCGDLVARVRFILKRFAVPAPKLILDVSPIVRDVMSPDMTALSTQSTVKEALELMEERGIRVLPALDDRQRFKGFVSIFKLSRFLSGCFSSAKEPLQIITSANQVTEAIDGQPVNNPSHVVNTLRLRTHSNGLQETDNGTTQELKEGVIAVLANSQERVNECPHFPVGSIIVATPGQTFTEQAVQEANERSVSLISSPLPLIETLFRIRSAARVESMLHSGFEAISQKAPLPEVRSRIASSQYQAFPVLDSYQRTVGILKKTDLLKKSAKKLILVDHNELSQAVAGADQAEILEIIDHHRLGSLATSQPILFRNEPVGSTSTIVADAFFRSGLEIPKPIAGLLLAGLVSDTLNLQSPTTTDQDAKILKRLEIIADLNATRFTETLFSTGSILSTLPPEKAILADSKEFEHGDHKFSIAQIEEIGLEKFWEQEQEIRSALEHQREQSELSFAALFITDILKQCSVMLIVGDNDVMQRVNQRMIKPGVFELPGIVSRKKQLLPYLTERLEEDIQESTNQRDEPLTMV